MMLFSWPIDALRWHIWPNGVVCVGRLPTPQEGAGWASLHRPLSQYVCVCGKDFWSWKNSPQFCSFKCYRQRRAK